MKWRLLPGFVRVLVWGLALAGWLLPMGCATQRQVQQIIDQSNLAAVSAELGLDAVDPAQPSGSGDDWKIASAKIESFIAAHPDNPNTTAALRVRQAMLLLNNRQYQLAQAAFDQAPLPNLFSTRDRSLKQLQEPLLWWYPSAGGSIRPEEYRAATNYQAQIANIQAALTAPADESMRDWLAAWRAFIGLKLANDADADVLGAEAARWFLEDAVNTYAAMLPAGETERWLADTQFPPVGGSKEVAVGASMRRRFRAEEIVLGAQKAMRGNAIQNPRLRDEFFRKRIR